MQEVNDISELTRLIADNGIMLVMSTIMIVIFLNIFKKTTRNWERIEKKNDKLIDTILAKGTATDFMDKQNEINNNMLSILKELKEGATRECTIEQVKVVSNGLFDLSKRLMYEEAIQAKKENHLDNRPAIESKIKAIVWQKVNNKKSKLYNFYWKGKPLSEFIPDSKVADVAEMILDELYASDGFSEDRLWRNIELYYDGMKLEFFKEIVSYNKL